MDGQDETFCFYDGQLVDDKMFEFLSQIREGVRCFVITDCCNSGSNLRAMRPSTPKTFDRAVPSTFKGQLIHYAGCGDGRFSYGSEEGGVFTNTLLMSYRRGISYTEWFDYAKARMPRNQKPVYTEYGNVSGVFRAQPVFT